MIDGYMDNVWLEKFILIFGIGEIKISYISELFYYDNIIVFFLSVFISILWEGVIFFSGWCYFGWW